MKIAGVYKITNNITGDFYIGSSKDIKLRWAKHKCLSTHKQHPNSKLYKDMAQYGRDNFTFEIIEKTDNLKEREQYYIGQLKPTYNDRHADGNMNLYKKACERALLDIYFDLATCDKLMKKHPDWKWLVDKKAELEAKEAELVKELV